MDVESWRKLVKWSIDYEYVLFWIQAMDLSPYVLIFVLMIFYIILGMFLDGISAVVFTMAIIEPMIRQAGFDMIWFGIFLVVVVEMDIFIGVDEGIFLLSSIEFGLISWSDTELDLLISTAFAGLEGLVGTVVFLTFIFLIGSLLQLT